jgi:hypothetical protein
MIERNGAQLHTSEDVFGPGLVHYRPETAREVAVAYWRARSGLWSNPPDVLDHLPPPPESGENP